MRALPSHEKIQEAVCPACNAVLTQCAGRRKKKVQCPKCLETVVLGTIELFDDSAPTPEIVLARELMEIKTRLAQLSPLKTRLAEVEAELDRLKSAIMPKTAPEAPPVQPTKPSSLDEKAVEGAAAAPDPAFEPATVPYVSKRYGFGEEEAHDLGAILRASRGSRLGIAFAQGSPVARSAAEYLRNLLISLGWIVPELRTATISTFTEGLALATGPGAISPLSSTIRRAFAASNIALSFQIDPGITDSSITLVVGAPPPECADDVRA